MKRKIILIGYFSETAELAQKLQIDIVGYIDGQQTYDYPELNFAHWESDEAFLKSMRENKEFFFITPDRPFLRKKLYLKYQNVGRGYVNLISERANISSSAHIIEHSSTMIQDLVNVSANVTLGVAVRINSCANVMHDCKIGNFVTIAPNAVLLGGVEVGESVYVGASATVLPGIKIGHDAIIGAGAVVTKDVANGATVVGSPARPVIK